MFFVLSLLLEKQALFVSFGMKKKKKKKRRTKKKMMRNRQKEREAKKKFGTEPTSLYSQM